MLFKAVKSFSTFIPFALPGIAVVIFLSFLGSFSRLIADDYCSAYFATTLGGLRSIWFWYLNWNGRYSNAIVDNILAISPFVVRWGLFATLTAWLSATGWVAYLLFPNNRSGWERIWKACAGAFLVVFGTLALEPSPSQSLFWWGGLRAYTLSLVFVTLEVGSFSRMFGKGKNRVASFAIGLVLGLFCAGFSETLTPVLLVVWFSVAASGIVSGLKKSYPVAFDYSIASVIGAVLGLVVMILAPGNTNRQALSPVPPGFLEMATISLQGYSSFFSTTIASKPGLIVIAGIFVASVWLGLSMQVPPGKFPLWSAPIAIVTGLVIAFGFFPPAAYGLKEILPYRSQILPVFCLITSVTVAGILFGGAISRQFTNKMISRLVYLAACLLLFLAAGTYLQYLAGNINILRNYASYWDVTYTQISAAKKHGDGQVTIHSIRNWAGLNDPGDNPKFWVNYCISKYYGIDILADDSGMQSGDFIQ